MPGETAGPALPLYTSTGGGGSPPHSLIGGLLLIDESLCGHSPGTPWNIIIHQQIHFRSSLPPLPSCNNMLHVRPCLVPLKNQKISKIFFHIESYDTYIEC